MDSRTLLRSFMPVKETVHSGQSDPATRLDSTASKPSLPLPNGFSNDDQYVDELLAYATTNEMLQLLTGGVHILDFFTRDPDFYDWVLPASWRQWFSSHDLPDIMDFILRDDLSEVISDSAGLWRGRNGPPNDLLEYIWNIRRLLLKRTFTATSDQPVMPYHVALGMKVKKIHEVGSFSAYIDRLATKVEHTTGRKISHLVDFGAGQNYLGRCLANPPIARDVIAVESNANNVESAKLMDRPGAKIAAKLQVERNGTNTNGGSAEFPTKSLDGHLTRESRTALQTHERDATIQDETRHDQKRPAVGTGSMNYISQKLDSGDLTPVVATLNRRADDLEGALNGLDVSTNYATSNKASLPTPNLMVISLHSCGNLSHHGLRSLIQNPEVSAVAIVGCCYNLITERLTKQSPDTSDNSHKRMPRGRLHDTAGDPLGFPMSNKLFTYPVRPGKTGVHLNITTRHMAVQAPTNWTPEECESFITKHFYRSLFQKLLLDYGVIKRPASHDPSYLGYVAGESQVGHSAASGGLSDGPVIIVGKLGKAAFKSFSAYVRTALGRLSKSGNEDAEIFQKLLDTLTTEELQDYEERLKPRKKEIGILWTLIAYSAGLAEAIVVVDRWQWLREQECVSECWVEPVFDYRQSPRNLAVIGIKKWQ